MGCLPHRTPKAQPPVSEAAGMRMRRATIHRPCGIAARHTAKQPTKPIHARAKTPAAASPAHLAGDIAHRHRQTATALTTKAKNPPTMCSRAVHVAPTMATAPHHVGTRGIPTPLLRKAPAASHSPTHIATATRQTNASILHTTEKATSASSPKATGRAVFRLRPALVEEGAGGLGGRGARAVSGLACIRLPGVPFPWRRGACPLGRRTAWRACRAGLRLS